MDPQPKNTGKGNDEIRRVCDEHGCGNVMAIASLIWQKKLGHNSGGAQSVGPCIASLEDCGCRNDKNKCNWCAGTGKVTRRVKQAKDDLLKAEKKQKVEEVVYKVQGTLMSSDIHITKNDKKGLDLSTMSDFPDKHIKVKCQIVKGGWLVWVSPTMSLPDYKGYSQSFKKLIKIAKEHKCEYVKIFDCGPEYDGLSVF